MIDKLPICGRRPAASGEQIGRQLAILSDRFRGAVDPSPPSDTSNCVVFNSAAHRAVLLMLATSVMLTGCRKVDSGERVPLTGSISVNGLLLDVKATIYFDPLPGQNGVGAAGEVKDSMFSIPADAGPTPGMTYNVTVITSPGIPADGTPFDQIKQPETYKTQVEIPPASGKEEVPLGIDIMHETP